MKFLSIKYLLVFVGFVWVALSFFWFSGEVSNQSTYDVAEQSLVFAESEILQKSKDLRFKLGQWSYNYHLVKTKGLDFDQNGFLRSEFQDIYFFKFEDGEFKTQWYKSKDISSSVVPVNISAKVKYWSKDQVFGKDYIFFTENIRTNGSKQIAAQNSKVYFGFPVSDNILGEGLLLSALDLDFVQLLNPKFKTYAIDSKGRFLYHPKKEYIGQSASAWIKSENTETYTLIKKSKIIDGDFLYRQQRNGLLAQTFWPTLVMLLGLLFIFGVFIFEMYMLTPIVLKQPTLNTNTILPPDLDKDEYGSMLKLNEIHESLNRMSLLSTVLKGRLDLAALGEYDQKLFEDIKIDFEHLDQIIDNTYKSTQVNDVQPEKAIVTNNNQPKDDVTDLLNLEDHNYEDEINTDDLKFETHELILSENTKPKSSVEGVVFHEYIGAESESNDWAKIIEELTEEINTVELKPTNEKNISG